MDDVTDLDSLDEFIQSKQKFMESFCNKLGWQFPPALVEMPTELAKSTKRKKHVADKTCEKFPEYFDSLSTNSKNSILLTTENIKSVLASTSSTTATFLDRELEVPESAADLVINFDSAQRLALYEHIVKNTESNSLKMRLCEFDLAFERETGAEGSDGKSIFEMQSEERDAKRRRINYKQAKKIHTSNKTHTEVLAEVIKNQMDMYQEWLKGNDDVLQPEIPPVEAPEKTREDGSSCGERKSAHGSHKRERGRSRSPKHREGKKHKKHKHGKRSRSRDKDRKRHSKSKKHSKSRE